VFVIVVLGFDVNVSLLSRGDCSKRLVRSEGLAVASFDMFKDGIFSSDPALPCRVNSHGLKMLQLKQLAKGFQVSKHNPMVSAWHTF
jgi:hypothetical protein